jgi:hypothetical protein
VYYQLKTTNVKQKNPIEVVKTKEQQEELISAANYHLIRSLENAKVGDLIQLQNLNFYFNSE